MAVEVEVEVADCRAPMMRVSKKVSSGVLPTNCLSRRKGLDRQLEGVVCCTVSTTFERQLLILKVVQNSSS